MRFKLHLWLVIFVGVGAYTLQSSSASQDVASSTIDGQSVEKVRTARRRRRRSSSSSSGSSKDLAAINAALKEVTKEVKVLKESFVKGLESVTKAAQEKAKAHPSPAPAPKPKPIPKPPPPKPSGASGKVPIGHNVALHNAKANRFLRMHAHGYEDGSGEKDVDKFPSNWEWEKFYTKDVGGGKVAFYCASHGRWISTHRDDMKTSNPGDARRNPGGWEHFTIVPVAGGKVKLKTHRGTFVRMSGANVDHKSGVPDEEITFTVVDLGKTNPPPPPRRG
jgi:hypothetical protein